MYKVNNVKVSLKATVEDYPKLIASHLNLRVKDVTNVKLLKRSVDARKQVHYIASFAFDCAKSLNLPTYEPVVFETYDKVEGKIVIVGSGPAGLFACWQLAKSGCDVTLIERGQEVEKRIEAIETFRNTGVLNTKSNIQFGEGGAGTFSDGKLTTGTKDRRISLILDTFVKYGAPEDILYEAMPHIGTDYLRRVIVNMREDLKKMGAKVLFESQMTDLKIEDHAIKAIEINHNEWKECDALILAIGHSARDTFELLYERGFAMKQKPFSVGVRIEHLQSDVSYQQYQQAMHQLKPASYKASYHASNGRGVYTFCMCPGGYVVPAASEEGMVCTNGMSEYARDGKNANSALLVNVDERDYGSDHVLAGMYFQRDLERKAFELGGGNYKAPCSRVGDYLNHTITTASNKVTPSYLPGVTYCDLHELFSQDINEALHEGLVAFGKKLAFFKDEDAIMTGIEARSSSPVRFERSEQLESNITGVYPCGEGAGMAGGIISAAVDGLKAAEAILTSKTRL